MIKRLLGICMVAAVALTGPVSAWAGEEQAPSGDGSKVLATINGEQLTEAEFDMILGAAGASGMSGEDKRVLIDQVVDMVLLAQQGEKAGVQENPDFKREMALIRQQQLYKYYVMGEIVDKTEVTDEEVLAYYDANRDQYMSGETVTASHILVDAEDEANAIKARLDAGENFEELAKSESKCPSSVRGGDLGTFGRNRMVKEFEDAAFALEVGKISEPVHTQFGWHIIKVTEHPQAAQKPLEEVKDDIKNMLVSQKQEQAYDALIEKLRSEGEVSVDEEAFRQMPDPGDALAEPAEETPADTE